MFEKFIMTICDSYLNQIFNSDSDGDQVSAQYGTVPDRIPVLDPAPKLKRIWFQMQIQLRRG